MDEYSNAPLIGWVIALIIGIGLGIGASYVKNNIAVGGDHLVYVTTATDGEQTDSKSFLTRNECEMFTAMVHNAIREQNIKGLFVSECVVTRAE